MNDYFLLAFVVMPALVVALGLGAYWLHGWSMRNGREDR
jgi:hypothetical protein